MFGFFTTRRAFFFIFVVSAGFLIFNAWMYAQVKFSPCTMDFVERVLMLLVASVSLIVFFMKYQVMLSKKIGGMVCLIFSGLGIYISWHHWWMQHLPSSQLSSYLKVTPDQLQYLGFPRIVLVGCLGDQSCAAISWVKHGISSPGWFVGIFGVIALVSLLQWFFKR